MQAGVQQLWYKDINAGGSRIARHADDESRKVALQSPISKGSCPPAIAVQQIPLSYPRMVNPVW